MGIGGELGGFLAEPDIAFLLLYLGLVLVVVEFVSPGIGVAGIVGALSLLGAIAGLGQLSVQAIGLVLLAISVGFFLLEVKMPGISFAGLGGIAALILGGIFLFDPEAPHGGVSWWVLAPIALGAAAFFAFVVPAVLKARKLPSMHGNERVLGKEGIARTGLNPFGTVTVGAEEWSAESVGPDLPAGTRVRVVGAEGLRLKVEASPANAGATTEASER